MTLTRLFNGEFRDRKLELVYQSESLLEFIRHARLVFASACVVNPLFLFSDMRYFGQSRFAAVLTARLALELACLLCMRASGRARTHGALQRVCILWGIALTACSAVLASSHQTSALVVTFLLPPVLILTLPLTFRWAAALGLACGGMALAAYMPPEISRGDAAGLLAGMLLWIATLAMVRRQNSYLRRLHWNAAQKERLARERLEMSRDSLQEILTAIPAPLLVADRASGALRLKNAAAEEYFNFQQEGAALNVEALFHYSDWGRLLKLLELGGKVEGFEARVYLRDWTEKSVLLAATALNYEGAEAILLNFVDITSRKEAESQLDRLANTDPLTELPNRLCFFSMAAELVRESVRLGAPMAFFMVDIDYFKRVNDTYGHEFGDRCLSSFSMLLRNWAGSQELAGRLGGEEFAVALPGATAAEAMTRAQRLRADVEQLMVEYAGVAITVSIGVANLAPGELSVEPALARADLALYAAKRQGRNRCIAFEELGSPEEMGPGQRNIRSRCR